ncbi:MAG TPA: glutathione synthase, partial [Burkholderiaceae bacterium]|nr:glutathione synthase [Burkholderiaceae bacterium]
MKLLFIADPIESFKVYKDSTFAMMREAQRRGHTLLACEPQHLSWRRGARVVAQARTITLTGGESWYQAGDAAAVPLHEVGAVLMRKDPPFDSEYFYATHLLQQA